MIYNNSSEKLCTMYFFHPILLPSFSMLIPNCSDAVNAICNGACNFCSNYLSNFWALQRAVRCPNEVEYIAFCSAGRSAVQPRPR